MLQYFADLVIFAGQSSNIILVVAVVMLRYYDYDYYYYYYYYYYYSGNDYSNSKR